MQINFADWLQGKVLARISYKILQMSTEKYPLYLKFPLLVVGLLALAALLYYGAGILIYIQMFRYPQDTLMNKSPELLNQHGHRFS